MTPAGGSADTGTRRRTHEGGDQPAGGHDRTDAGNGQHAEPGEQPCAAADHGADGSARSGTRAGLARRGIGGGIAIVGIVRHEADVVMGNTGRFQVPHGIGGIVIAVIELRDCPNGHVASHCFDGCLAGDAGALPQEKHPRQICYWATTLPL